MILSNDAIYAMANNKRWPNAIISRSGYADHVALVISEQYTIKDRVIVAQHAEFFVFDHAQDIDSLGKQMVIDFNKLARPGEPTRTYIRFLNLGPATGHVFERTPMSNNEGELFKCAGCGMVVTGKPELFKGSQYMSPYVLISPDKPSERRAYFQQCPSIRALPAQRANVASEHPELF